MARMYTILIIFTMSVVQIWAAPTSTVQGQIGQAGGRDYLNGASVILTNESNGKVHGGFTNAKGRFSITSIPAGTYTLKISMVGYKTIKTENVEIVDGDNSFDYDLETEIVQKDATVVTASRMEQKALEAPSAITVIDKRVIMERPAQTPVEYLQGTAGMDQAQTGISQRAVNVRGFNNAFTGTLMILTDYRLSGIPSLRANIPYYVPMTNEDIEKIELVRGPGSALYGPNAAQGVMNIITRSPFSSQGTSVFVTGGLRSSTDVPTDDGNYYSHVGMRHAGTVGDKFGYKVSGQYVNAWDWAYVDPEEERLRSDAIAAGADPDTLIVGKRDNIHRHYNFDARLDYMLGDEATITLMGGYTKAVSTVELNDLGASMGVNWSYLNFNTMFTWNDLFAQVFYNQSDAGETYNLRSGRRLVDRSNLIGARLQHASYIGERLRLTYGGDFFSTNPITEGTINGRNEDSDSYTEFGIYLQADADIIKDKLSFLAAGRYDQHSVLESPVFSPRAALLFNVTPTQTVRATFNQAFTTPTSVDLFLDIQSVPDAFGLGAINPAWSTGVYAASGGLTGYTFPRVGGIPQFVSQFNRTTLTHLDSASSNGVWEATTALVSGGIAASEEIDDETKALLLQLLGAIPPPSDIKGNMATLNPSDGTFAPVGDVLDVNKLVPTSTTTFELGYQGVVTDKLHASLDVYYTTVENFISSTVIVTPNVFLDFQETKDYFKPIIKGTLLQQDVPEEQAEALSEQLSNNLAAQYAQVPVGTVSPNETPYQGDIVLAARNFGELSYYGADLAIQFVPVDWLELGGAFTYMAKAGGSDSVDGLYWTAEEIGGVQDFSFNAPAYKGSLFATYRNLSEAVSVGAQWRWTDSFKMISGVFQGDIEAINMIDLHVQYALPWVDGLRTTLTMLNVLDHRARQFIGAPLIGRLTTLRLDYTF